MLKIAYSTVSCPTRTLEHVFERAGAWGYHGVDLRTFGEGSRLFACDPALTAPEKILRLSQGVGVQVAAVSTSIAFDEPIRPAVLGYAIGDTEASVRATKRAIDLATTIECPLVRVFGFEIPGREKRASCVHRIVERLGNVVDHAHRTGVRVMIENGGSFARAAELAEVLDEVSSPLLGACYNVATAWASGERPWHGLNALGANVFAVRLKDLRDGRPAPIGQGDVPCREAVEVLTAGGFGGPVICEWDRAWLEDLAPAEQVLPAALKQTLAWAGEAGRGTPAESAVAR